MTSSGLESLLDAAREDLESALGRHRFRLWFRDVVVERVLGRTVTLGVPTEVHRTWLQYNWASLLAKAFERLLGEGVTVELEVVARLDGRRAIRDRLPESEEAWEELVAAGRPPPDFATFVGDEPGAFAVGLLSQVVHGNGSAAPASVYLYGEAGTGKSHLLGALARAMDAATPGAALVATARQFTSRFVGALRAREPAAVAGFQADVEGRQVLVLDDLDELAGKPATQHELDRLLDGSGGRRLRFVAAGRLPPRDLPDVSDRLRSRLLGGVVHRLPAPDAARRRDILRRRAAAWRAPVPAEALDAIVERAPSWPAAIAWFDRYAAVAAREGGPLPAEWIAETSPPRAALSTRDDVVRRAKDLVARHYGLRPALLDRPSKQASTLLPRRIAMYLVYRAASLPLSELGKAFGLKSHASAARAIREVRARRDDDPTVEVVVDGLLAEL